MKAKINLSKEFKGGVGSGHHGHAGRPGKRGGSAPGSGGGGGSITSGSYSARASDLRKRIGTDYTSDWKGKVKVGDIVYVGEDHEGKDRPAIVVSVQEYGGIDLYEEHFANGTHMAGLQLVPGYNRIKAPTSLPNSEVQRLIKGSKSYIDFEESNYGGFRDITSDLRRIVAEDEE